MTMPIEQMIEKFKQQQKEVVEDVRNLESQINTKKEDYFKLQGAIEALEIAIEKPSIEDQSGQPPSQPPGYELPENLKDIPDIDVMPPS